MQLPHDYRVATQGAEHIRLREKGFYLIQQLELLLCVYRIRLQKKAIIRKVWSEFWHDLDAILPEFPSEERCLHYCNSESRYVSRDVLGCYYCKKKDRKQLNKVELERQALFDQRYRGVDFMDVVWVRFVDDLVAALNALDALPTDIAQPTDESDESCRNAEDIM